jgi:hypothetical protein
VEVVLKHLKIDLKKLVSISKHLNEDPKDHVDAKSGDEKKLKFIKSFVASGKQPPPPPPAPDNSI